MAAVRAHGHVLIDEGNHCVASQPFIGGTPVAPAVWRFNGGFELFARQLAFSFAHLLMIVQKFQKHHPGEHGQTVGIAVQAFVLAHDGANGLDDGTELLGGGLGLGCFLGGHADGFILGQRLLSRVYKPVAKE